MTTLNPYDAPQSIEPRLNGDLTDNKQRNRFLAAIYFAAAACCASLSVAALLSGLFYMLGGPYWIAGTSQLLALLLAVVSLVLALKGVLRLTHNSTTHSVAHKTFIPPT
jgi:membrane protein YdbS with pleckstrin-like domain